ncbi:unnamed protein product [Arabis nemorensis]|uniref:Uncharacterized protein n=1 Tax=Arabis nemorensis TaxID=586526 RepID=A0A565AUP4_9BRAS|nr:unnamed protein product [Arabis nemorensis]
MILGKRPKSSSANSPSRGSPALAEPTVPLLFLTYKESALLARSPSRESLRPKGSYHSPGEVAGTYAACDARGRRAPGEPEQVPEQPELSSPLPPQESGLAFYERWLGMTQSWDSL